MKSLLTYKRLELFQPVLRDELFFSMVSDDGMILTQSLHLTNVNVAPETDALPISSCYRRLAARFFGPRK